MLPTPERPRERSGVPFSALLALLALVSAAGCDHPPEIGASVHLNDSTAVDLGPGTAVHEIRIRGGEATDTLVPDTVRARPGDAVRFVAGDRRTHAIAFLQDALSPAARRYLEQSMQLRGPPLVDEGSTWVVVLRDAPPGSYPFQCVAHGARGVIVVRPGGPD